MSKDPNTTFCRGKVKFYDSSKNHFGFIQPIMTHGDNISEDIHFKELGLRNSTEPPRDGENIYCYAKKGGKGYYSDDVIREGELLLSERIEYLKLLLPKDLILLIEEIQNVKSAEYDDLVSDIYPLVLDFYKESNRSKTILWKFLYDHASENDEHLLEEDFVSFDLENQLRLGLNSDRLLKKAIKHQYFFGNNNNLCRIIQHLWSNDKQDIISDDHWVQYLQVIGNDYQPIFQALQSGFKIEITLKNCIWSYNAINELLDDINRRRYKLEPEILVDIFKDNFQTYISDLDNFWHHSAPNKDPYKSFIKKIFSLPDHGYFHDKFTDIFCKYISQIEPNKSIVYITSIDELTSEKNSKKLTDFKKKVFEVYEMSLTTAAENDDEEQIIEIYDSLETVGLGGLAENLLSPPSKIELKLSSGRSDLDFEKDVKYLDQINFEGQQQFFRALVKSVRSDNKNHFWSTIDKLRKDILSPKGKNYDPSTVFCIYLLLKIRGQQSLHKKPLNTTDLFKFVYEKLTTPTLINNKLGSYFEKCSGRGYPKNINIDTPETAIKWEVNRTKISPCNFCEGSLMIDHQTDVPLVDKKTGENKYWCRNSVCLSPSRQQKNDTIYFSDILDKLDFTATDNFVGYVNGWVNKINSFLDHLTCNNCHEVLEPTDIGSGYYRVSYFKCANSSCSVHKNDESIYLSHCINPKCNEVIDSRSTKKCAHGWYICPHCYGCCSTEKIQNRIIYYQQIGKPYEGATKGHKELKAIFCPECGNSISSGGNSDQYNRMLNRFLDKKTKHPNIIKYDKRKNDGKYWFLLKKSPESSIDDFNVKINILLSMGFDLADDYETGKEIALISESSGQKTRRKNCQNCNHTIDLNNMYKEGDYYRAKAIENWYPTLFK